MNIIYKLSDYNHRFRLLDKLILFNARTLAICELDEDAFSKIDNITSENLAELDLNFQEELAHGGFLIPKDVDELGLISKRLWKARENELGCSITIAPTLGCNFNCTYCFESEDIRSNHKIMSEETQDILLKKVETMIIKQKIKELKICWFGGEPLLALPAIERMSEKIQKFVRDNEIVHKSDIITNGYKLDKQNSLKLKKAGITKAQVTIDGPECIHDSRRILKGGKGSYNRIMSNINEAAKFIDIVIRVNIDKQNSGLLVKLLDELDYKLINRMIPVYLGHVVLVPKMNFASQISYSNKEFSDINIDFEILGASRNFNTVGEPTLVSNVCGADHRHSFMVGPSGEMYQCWEDFGKPNAIIGNLREDDKLSQSISDEYLEFDPTQNPKCKDCRELPMCMGGCPKRRLEANGIPQCGIYKFNLKGYLNTYLNSS